MKPRRGSPVQSRSTPKKPIPYFSSVRSPLAKAASTTRSDFSVAPPHSTTNVRHTRYGANWGWRIFRPRACSRPARLWGLTCSAGRTTRRDSIGAEKRRSDYNVWPKRRNLSRAVKKRFKPCLPIVEGKLLAGNGWHPTNSLAWKGLELCSPAKLGAFRISLS